MNRVLILFLVLICKAEAQSSALQLADSLYTYGAYSKAISVYKPFEDKPEVAIKMAKASVAIGNIAQGLEYYKKGVDGAPDNLLYAYDYAKLLSKTQRLEEARNVLKALTLVNNRNPNYQYELGLVKQKQKDSTYIDNFLKTIALDAQHLKAINKLARYALSKRKYDEALKLADQGLAIYKSSKDLISLKAQVYYWQEDYFHATEWFLKRLELGEPTQYLYERLSYCYSRNYDHANTIKYLKEALEFEPNNADNLSLIARQYGYMDDFKNAEKYYVLALKLKDIPLDTEYSALGNVLNRQKKYKEAIEAFKTALRHNPQNKYTPFFLARSKVEYYKDIDAKIKVYDEFIKKYPGNQFIPFAEDARDKLKQEKFMNGDTKN